MSTPHLSDIILERNFEALDTDGTISSVTLQLAKPYTLSTSKSSLIWRCPFQILGIGSQKIHEGPGIDSINALLNSLRLAEMLISSYGKRFHKTISWLQETELGFSPESLNDETTELLTELEAPFQEIFDAFFANIDKKDTNL